MSGEPEELPDPSTWGWTGELTATDLQTVTPVSLELIQRGGEWVNRRVESVTLLDEVTARLQLSVDFRVPRELPGQVAFGNQKTYFLPLTLLERRTDFSYFDARDEGGNSVPILTRQENARLTGAILIASARQALDRASKSHLQLAPGLRTYLAAIPTKSEKGGRIFIRSILNEAEELMYPDRSVATALLSDNQFIDLLGICASCSIVHLPVAADGGERRIIKLAWDANWSPEPPPGPPQGAAKKWQTRGRRLMTWLGWRAYSRYLSAPQVGSAESYHVQIAAPDNVEFTDAGLLNAHPRTLLEPQAPTGKPLPALVPRNGDQPFERTESGISQRKHLYVERAHEHRAGITWVRLRASRHGFLRAAPITGWAVTALLVAFALRADNIVGESETAAALLLLVPALIAGFLVSPGEHAMARHLVRGPRLLTAVVGLCALIAVVLLVVVPEAEHGTSGVRAPLVDAPSGLVGAWIALAIITAITSVLLLGSLLRPSAGRRKHQAPAPHHAPFTSPQNGAPASTDQR